MSEIAMPVVDRKGKILAIFDVDSDRYASFDEVDQSALCDIMKLIYRKF